MSAEAVAKILESIGTWPVLTVLLILTVVVVLAPWCALVYLKRNDSKQIADILSAIRAQMDAQGKKHDEVVRFYENNVELVKNFDKLAKDLKDVIVLNTSKWATAISLIVDAQYCPLMKKDIRDLKNKEVTG
ncbi:MAG: hypothetical protein EPN22_16945 [Nitrospirae bacterium]|nr:MAG: hypothetical protein EPN22_16945 [Nitrospirota bacterium]